MKLSDDRIDEIVQEFPVIDWSNTSSNRLFARAIESEVAKMWQERMRERAAKEAEPYTGLNIDTDIRALPIEESSDE